MLVEITPWLEDDPVFQERLDRVNERLGNKRRLYNSMAIAHNNARVTFPAILVANRLGYTKLGLYEPAIAADAATDREQTTQLNLSDDSKVMNAYMLWAVAWGGSTDLEDSAQKARS